MSTRESIELTDNTMDVLIKMSEGNPGAVTVLTEMIKRHPMDGLIRILDIDDMNIRGSQIWIGYKDHCGEDIEKFMACCQSRDQAMVDTINANRGMSSDHLAVTHGGSYKNRK